MCHTLACMAYVLTNLLPLSGQSSAGKRVRAQLKMGEHPGWTFLWLILWSEYVLAKLLYILNIEMIPVMWDNTFIFIQSFLNNSRLILTLSECVINSRSLLSNQLYQQYSLKSMSAVPKTITILSEWFPIGRLFTKVWQLIIYYCMAYLIDKCIICSKEVMNSSVCL